ncbi:MAG TPA: aminomethyltransferase family protein [Pyrinomonadaceae bacterium]|nr:aminomethyltransferase family protein [Pyrinomonadaceae bacterium]
MNESVATKAAVTSPLDSIHQRLGATMIERDGWSLPQSYGDVLLEYATVREGAAGLIDLSSRGRIMVSGTEAVQFLNGLITNDMKTLAEHSWMPAAFPNVQGRLIASVRVIRLHDNGTDGNVCPVFLIDTEAATHGSVLKNIERFTLAGDFRVTDVTNQTAMLSVQGKKAVEMVRAVVGDDAAEIAANGVEQIEWPRNAEGASDVTEGVMVMRAAHTAEDGFDFVVPSNDAGSLFEELENAGARPVGHDALEMLRIEAGVPLYGVDMDETNVVTEAALDDAVSYTKGCYVGQEIIARIKYRGHVAKKLSGLMFEQAVPLEVGSAIQSSDGKEIGRITSKTYSPHLGRTIALAYLKYDYLAAGTQVKVVSAANEWRAQVTELPFVNGSWRKKKDD